MFERPEEIHQIFEQQIMQRTQISNKEIQRKLSAEAIARLRSFDRQFSDKINTKRGA